MPATRNSCSLLLCTRVQLRCDDILCRLTSHSTLLTRLRARANGNDVSLKLLAHETRATQLHHLSIALSSSGQAESFDAPAVLDSSPAAIQVRPRRSCLQPRHRSKRRQTQCPALNHRA